MPKRRERLTYELVGNSVSSGLVIALGQAFPGVTRYRETVPVQFLQYPHFFVHNLTVSTQTERRNFWLVDYLATIRYHVAADPSSVVGSLQQQLDDIGIRMLSELENITWDGMPVRITQPRVEKVDGVLHWFGNISVMATKPVETDPLQEQLTITTTTAQWAVFYLGRNDLSEGLG